VKSNLRSKEMTDLNSRIDEATSEVAQLKDDILKGQLAKRDQSLGTVARKAPATSYRTPPSIKKRRDLKGHFGKVVAMHWSSDSYRLVSAGQDGNLLIWNALTANKIRSIALKSSYVMGVGMEQTKGDMVACGGLDNLCTIYRLSNANEGAHELGNHAGFISCCRFSDEQKILTASGDSTCIRWDIETGGLLETFEEHKFGVMFLSRSPTERDVFATCSVDQTCKLWDCRAPRTSVQTFFGHTEDINSIEFMPSDSNCFASCSDDLTVRLWDIRTSNEITKFEIPQANKPQIEVEGVEEQSDSLTSLAFSSSGRLIFTGHSDGSVLGFDVLSDKTHMPAFTLKEAHERHVSCIGVAPSGDAVCTGSWDSSLKIWA